MSNAANVRRSPRSVKWQATADQPAGQTPNRAAAEPAAQTENLEEIRVGLNPQGIGRRIFSCVSK